MDLPLTLQMEIDLSAAAHKREVADGFARLRKRLIPTPTKAEVERMIDMAYQQYMMNMATNDARRNPYSSLAPMQSYSWGGLIGPLGSAYYFGHPSIS